MKQHKWHNDQIITITVLISSNQLSGTKYEVIEVVITKLPPQ